MKRIWTIIGVDDVAASFAWYQALFGHEQTQPAHDYFGQICDSDGTVLLCIHAWGAHDHPTLTSADLATPGNGLILFFSASTTSMPRWRGHGRWSVSLRKSLAGTPPPAPWNSRSSMVMATTSWSVRSLDWRGLNLGGFVDSPG